MEKKLFTAIRRTAQQISPDDWETVTKSLLITEDTTIGQLVAWHEKICPREDFRIGIVTSDRVPHLNPETSTH